MTNKIYLSVKAILNGYTVIPKYFDFVTFLNNTLPTLKLVSYLCPAF
jgi:hypothetical protein